MPLTTKEILKRKAWPRVEMVFTYYNHKTARTATAELARLQKEFMEANCPHIAEFISIIQFDEAVKMTAASYNFSLVPHFVEDCDNPSDLEIKAILLQPDLLIGSRCERECASAWLSTILKRENDLETEELQFIDMIFETAIQAKANPSQPMKLTNLIRVAEGRERMQDFPTERRQ